MQVPLQWHDILLRIGLALFAGALIGINRGEHGRTAGLRTTMLVTLAAAFSMIMTNLFLQTSGKSPDSFATLDPMRLPLGILSGMGFIGAGAILRRKDLIQGVTTAATLWFVTVMGLCIGSGQLILGMSAMVLGFFILEVLQHAEGHMRQDRTAVLTLVSANDGPTQGQLNDVLAAAGFSLVKCSTKQMPKAQRRSFMCEVRWRGRAADASPPVFLEELARRPGVLKVHWRP